MSSVRTCPSCKAELDVGFIDFRCKACGELFDVQRCTSCDSWKPLTDFNMYSHGSPRRECKPCGRKRRREHEKRKPDLLSASRSRRVANMGKKADELYEKLLKLTKAPSKPMTEDEWTEICRFFGGCAICGAERIEARQFFVPAKDGGKYTAWNMYPVCGDCFGQTYTSQNIFRWLNYQIGTSAKAKIVRKDYRDKMLGHLKKQIEKVIE